MIQIIIGVAIIFIIIKLLSEKKIKKEYESKRAESHIKDKEIKKEINSIEIIFFDTETNGLDEYNSVLSIVAVKGLVNLNTKTIIELNKFERYYYSKEPYNQEAININGLEIGVVKKLRESSGINYSEYFEDDLEEFYKFMDGVTHFVAHNIKFDSRYIRRKLPTQFCTMLTNTSIVKAKKFRNGKYKWPKLEETAKFYNIEIQEEKLHDSGYDVELTMKVFEKMLSHNIGKRYINNFIKSNQSYLTEL